MAVYVVTWNLNKEKDGYNAARKAFIAQIELYTDYHDPGLESVRFISTTETAKEISRFLREKLDENDRLFVSKLERGKYGGWLKERVWEWIKERL